MDLLGEHTVTTAEADRYAARVADLLEIFAGAAGTWPDDPHLERDPWGPVPRVGVSVKPTALAPRFGPLTAEEGLDEAVTRLRPILARARELGAAVTLDMEHYGVKDLTLELVSRLGSELPDGPVLGAVVQAYLRDSYGDLLRLVEWAERTRRAPLQVRLVKGAYWDTETVVARAEGWVSPVFEDKRETDANFERCARLLVARAGVVRPAFGSHNVRSLAYAVACARARGLHDGAVELQLLHGMAEPVHAALRRLGLRVRVYAPVGELVPGMAYLVRRLLENTSNESFIRHRFVQGEALESLVRPRGGRRAPSPARFPTPCPNGRRPTRRRPDRS
ncbi:MAG: proline dehydrogenase family protein [Acidimicrobiia bacterium]|nr:proline dehydrogenase family protein [Acidimicrobiia bacterium]